MDIGQNNTFAKYDKAMDLVTDILGEDLSDTYRISVVKSVCKVTVPLHVPLDMIKDRKDISVTFTDTTSEIHVH